MSLQAQMLWALGFLAVLPAVLLGIVHAKSAADSEAERADRETLLSSTSLARELGRIIDDHADSLRVLSADVAALGTLEPPHPIETLTARYTAELSGLYCLMVTDPRGFTVAGTLLTESGTRSMAGTVYGDRDWFKAVSNGAPVASELLTSRSTGRPAVILAVPIVDHDRMIGVAGAGIDLDDIEQALRLVTKTAPGLAVVVLDDRSRAIASAGSRRVDPLTAMGGNGIYRPPKGSDPELRTGGDADGDMRRGAIAPVSSKLVHWSIAATWPQAAIRRRALTSLATTGALGLLALALGVVAAVQLARAISRPVTRLSSLIEALGKGDLRVRPEPPERFHSLELVELNESIESMLGHLRAVVTQLAQTVIAVRDVTRRLREASAQMVAGSHAQKTALDQSKGAIVEMTDSIGHVGASVRALSDAASNTTTSILSLDQQIARIANSVASLGKTIDDAAGETDEVQEQASAVAASASRLGRTVVNTNESLQLLTASIQQIGERAERSQSLAHDALEAAEGGRLAVDATIGTAHEIQQRFSAVGSAVDNLASRSEAIGNVVRVIEDITRATQLLAINAAIIAAEGGDQGRRFGVVAERVKSMASETAESTGQITKLVTSVQADIRQAVEAVRSGQRSVQEGEQRAADAGLRLRAIIESSGQAGRTVSQIAEASRQQAERVQVVELALGEVQRAATRIEEAIKAQRQAQQRMDASVRGVREVGDSVRQSTEAQQTDSRAMTAAVKTMTGRIGAIVLAVDAQNKERSRIQSTLDVFEGASSNIVGQARQIDEVVRTLSDRLEQLEADLAAFRVR